MKKFIVSQESNIVLDDGRYLLESGDEIMVGPFDEVEHSSVDYWVSRMAETKDREDRINLVREITEAGMRDEVVGALRQMQMEFSEGE